MKEFLIKEQEVRTVMIRLFCEGCEREMKQHTGVSLNNPPLFTYECPDCEETVKSKHNYPCFRYVTHPSPHNQELIVDSGDI